jgi:hypothetical protein
MKQILRVSMLLFVLAGLFPLAHSAEIGWHEFQQIRAFAHLDAEPNDTQMSFIVFDGIGPPGSPQDESHVSYSIVYPDLILGCSITEQFGDFISQRFFTPAIVNNGWEYTFDFPVCGESPAARLKIFCPPGSISHTDSDGGNKVTNNDGSHTFNAVRSQYYADAVGTHETALCTFTYTSGITVLEAPLDRLQISDTDSKEK